MRPRVSIALLAVLLASLIRPAEAAWPFQPAINLPICRAADNQYTSVLVADGAGGVIVAWQDLRSGTSFDIYAQHVLASGVVDPAWPVDGRVICSAANDQSSPAIVSDGAGGAIIAWQDYRSGTTNDIYAQRVLASGVVDPAWPANGRALCTAASDQGSVAISSDGAGGAIVCWDDYRPGSTTDIYARRVTVAGVALWTPDGVAICAAANYQSGSRITSDGAGGAVITWSDFRNGIDDDVYAQRVLAGGTVSWTANGVPIATANSSQNNPAIATDGAGGAWIAYADRRGTGGYADVYANHVLASGQLDAALNVFGRAVCIASYEQNRIQIAPDAAGGAYVVWEDDRTLAKEIYAHHLTGSNVDPLWPVDGIAICVDPGDQRFPCIAPDGTGGAFIAWFDLRSINSSIYAQHVLPTGTDYVWPYNGRAVSTAGGFVDVPAIAADGVGGAVVAFPSQRTANYDIYAQRIEYFGRLGNPEPVIASVADVPNDQGGHLKLSWNASYLDLTPFAEIRQYEVWRSIPPAAAQAALRAGARLLRAGEAVGEVAGHAIRTTVTAAATIYWEYVGVQPARRFAGYSYNVPTTGDSVGGSNPPTQLMVLAIDNDNLSFWGSAPAAGYSVDNIPPSAPAPFTGAYAAGATHLHWGPNGEADLAGYRLYRGSSAGFVPTPGNRIASPPDTGYSDAGAAGSYYKLSAVDSHGNESAYVLLGPSNTTDVGDASPAALTFEAPQPNPATVASTLRFTLPHESRVKLEIFDASGRRVRTFAAGNRPAGAHALTWDLRDDQGRPLGAGLYLALLDVDGQRLTRRVVTLQ
jgi:hypothetical protein